MATKGISSTKFSIRWPSDSDPDKISKFLSSSKINKADFPKDFPPKDVELMSADNAARQLAQAAWTVSSAIDVLSSLLGVASTAAAEDDKLDSGLILHLASQAVTGIGAMLAPHAPHLVEEAISKRLELRANAIPAKLKSVESKLLSAEPFAQKPCGSGVSFQGIANEAPQPLQVSLPASFYRAVIHNPSNQNFSYRKDNFYNRNQDNRKNNKNWYNNNWYNNNNKNRFFQNRRGKFNNKNNSKTDNGKRNQGNNQDKDTKGEYDNNKNRYDNHSKYNRNNSGKYGKRQ